MELGEKFKALLKTTEGTVVLGGLLLTVLSPIFSSEIWAVITGISYVVVNIPGIITVVKNWYNNLKSGNTN